jgi:site-specific recombinase XerD
MHKSGLWQDYGLVFPSSVGTPLSHRNVVRSFKALLKHADLPPSVRLYDLRHTCATLLLSRNVHLSTCRSSWDTLLYLRRWTLTATSSRVWTAA